MVIKHFDCVLSIKNVIVFVVLKCPFLELNKKRRGHQNDT